MILIKYDANAEKIARLQIAINELQSEKETAESYKTSLLSYYETTDHLGWAGNYYIYYESNLTGGVMEKYEDYINRIDCTLDLLCYEQTRIENENIALDWDILGIRQALNELANWIRTLTN